MTYAFLVHSLKIMYIMKPRNILPSTKICNMLLKPTCTGSFKKKILNYLYRRNHYQKYLISLMFKVSLATIHLTLQKDMLLLKYRTFPFYTFKILNQKQFWIQYIVDLKELMKLHISLLLIWSFKGSLYCEA